ALFFLRRTGARTIEMRQLRWGHINWDAGVAVFSEHKTTRLNGLPRTIALEPGVLRFLRNLQRQRVAENEHVFLNSDNEPWTRRALNKHFRYYAKQLGLGGVSPYGLRHLYAINAVESGIAGRSLADHMGHATTDGISWYSRQTRQHFDHLRRVAEDAIK